MNQGTAFIGPHLPRPPYTVVSSGIGVIGGVGRGGGRQLCPGCQEWEEPGPRPLEKQLSDGGGPVTGLREPASLRVETWP